MNALATVGNRLVGMTGKAGMKIKAASPEILVATGVVGVVVGTVMACKATLRCDEVLEQMDYELSRVNEARERATEDIYSNEDYQKDLSIVYAKGGIKLAKLYGPAAIVIVVSLASILCGHNILRKRNLALTAAYGVVAESFEKYRERVRASEGDDADREYLHGFQKEVIGTEEFVDDNGKKHKEKIKGYNKVDTLSLYSRYFDDTCPNWEESVYYNESFLVQKQAEANRMLQRYGSLTLNDVYDLLGFERSNAGYVVGWIYDRNYNKEDHNFEDQVDFRIFNPRNSAAINGIEPVYLLDFNVQGTIYGKCPTTSAGPRAIK